MKTFTFNVENDNGEMVDKTESVSDIKHMIACDLRVQGYRTTFRIRQTGPDSVEAYNTKGNTITYHYGGFDGYEVVEPYDHGDWPKKPWVPSKTKNYWSTH